MSNLSTLAAAAGVRDQAPAITSAFFAASATMRFALGPILDFTKGAIPLEIWTAMGAGASVLAVCVMHFSEGRLIWTAAVIAGGAFGGSATMDPLMCRSVSIPHQATLYALGKVSGLGASMLWVRQAAEEVKKNTEPGKLDCVGHDCVRGSWLTIVSIGVPFWLGTLTWALRRLAQQKEKKKAA